MPLVWLPAVGRQKNVGSNPVEMSELNESRPRRHAFTTLPAGQDVHRKRSLRALLQGFEREPALLTNSPKSGADSPGIGVVAHLPEYTSRAVWARRRTG